MVLVGAGLHGGVEEAACDLAILGCEVAGLDGELLNRFHAGLGLGLRVDQIVGGILAFDAQRLGVAGIAVDANAAVWAEIATGQQQHHRVGVANARRSGAPGTDSEDREVVQAIHLDVVAQLTAFGLQQRCGIGDGHGLCGGTDFQRRINADRLSHRQFNVLPDKGLESGRGHGQRVGPGGHLRQVVVTGGGARRAEGGSRGGVARLQGCVCENGTRGIRNGPCDRASIALGETYGHQTQYGTS